MRTTIEISLARRAAKRLGRVPGFWDIPHNQCLEITAVVLGFEHWRSLSANAAKGPVSPLDEDLDNSALEARRTAQAVRLSAAVPILKEQQALSVIASWQPSAGRPDAVLNELDDIKPVLKARDAFFEQGLHRAYIVFFKEMLDWALFDINLAARVREPLAFIHSRRFDLSIPLLAPAALAENPTGFESDDLRQLEKKYPDGAIALLGQPLVDQTSDGQHWFTPGALVMDGQSIAISLRAGLGFEDLFEFRENQYRLLNFADVGQWCARTFAMCQSPKWQLDNGFDELLD
ncbi:hypothetical protein [Burkholderia sp. Ac-20365]|uniref:hypothetical protein n=1 Tax=Burkholderia sp. Ac-20365 TaxID=2703897 RepID=UPI00197C729D|nr:hypothetical protein [Burkholderia sp. Ac-20365]MBN3761157.1 hypothetical protein [Burkholderia sp. Ac-20365]